MQPPQTPPSRSTSIVPPSSKVSLFPTATTVSSPRSSSAGSSVRNPPSPISFATASRRPSFDLAAELLHSAGDLRAATDGQRQVCVPAFPSFLANALNGVLIQARAFAVEREASTSGSESTIPALSRSMALLACLRHAHPALAALAQPYLAARESLTSLVQSDEINGDLLDFTLDAHETIPFVASSSLCGPTKRVNLRLTDDAEKHFSTAAHDLAVDRAQVVILIAAYTLSTQHHLLSQRYRDLASDIVGQYEIRATYAAKTAVAGLEMVRAERVILSRDRERRG